MGVIKSVKDELLTSPVARLRSIVLTKQAMHVLLFSSPFVRLVHDSPTAGFIINNMSNPSAELAQCALTKSQLMPSPYRLLPSCPKILQFHQYEQPN